MNPEIKAELDALFDELVELHPALPAFHDVTLHERPENQQDASMRWCTWCRYGRLAKRHSDLWASIEDPGPLGAVKVMAHLKERRDLEAPK